MGSNKKSKQKIQNFVSPYSRNNNADLATIQYLLTSGSYMNVSKGIYTSGPNKNKYCVSKEFKTGSIYSAHYFDSHMNVKAIALNIISSFNDERVCPDYTIELNIPVVWHYIDSDQSVLVERFISNFVKLNSNTGWESTEISPWIEIMQALSHFSYHNSNGEYLLCDIQGGASDEFFVISDPVIMSKSKSNCGPANLGPKGISNFFARHFCNKYCDKDWILPSDTSCYYKKEEGSVMADEVKLLTEMVEEMEITVTGKCSDAKLERLVGKLDI